MDDNDWELSKENIQPRKEGRDISSLIGLTPRKETNLKLHNEKQQFELAIRSYDGPDPLDNWYRYIIWTEQHLLEGSDSDVRHLIERCIHLYKDDEKYKNDRKYLCIWLKYADSLKDPTEIFNYMHSQNIGTQHSLFYEDWATILESSGLLSQADEVYKLGIARKAQPVERLQRQHRAFEQRLVAFLRENVDSTDEPMTVESRMSLAPLKERSKGTVSNDRVKGRSKSSNRILSNVQPANQIKGAGFAIFNDENAPTTRLPTATGEWKKPPTNSTIVKENAPKPGQWNKSKVAIGAASKRQQGPVFNIYADEEPIHKPSDTPKQLIMSERMPLSSRKIDKKAGPEDVLQPIRQQADSNFEVMYCKELVYMGNQEFSLEELRGMEYIRKNGPINPSRNQCDFTTLAVTGMDLDETLMSSQKHFPKDGKTCVDDEDIEKTIMADGLAEEADKDISKRTEISKKLLFKNDKENQLESEAAEQRQNVPRENHQERHRISFSPQPITSPSQASDLLNKTEFANSLDVSGLCPLESFDDFMLQHFQSTAIIDLKQMKQEMLHAKQNRQAFCDNEISKIQRIDNFEEDFQRIDISGGKQFGHEKMPGSQKKFEDVPFSRVATNFNHEEGSDKNETELASLSGVLDFPMMLSSKENAAAFSRQQQEEGNPNYDQINKRSILQKENSDVRVFADTKEDHVKVGTPSTMDYQDEPRPTSQCLDFPMKLSSKVQPKPSTMEQEFDQIMGSEDDFMGNVMSSHEFGHYDIQMPTEVIKPKPVKAHFDILQSNEFDENKNAAIQNNLKFAIFEDDDKENCQIDISEKDQPGPGAFVKIRNDTAVKRPTFADEKSSAFGQLIGEKFAAKSFMPKLTNNSKSENESVGFAQGRKVMPFSVFSDDQASTAAESFQLDAKNDAKKGREIVSSKFPLSSAPSSRVDSKEAFRSSLSSSDGATGFKTPVSARKRMDSERGMPAFPLVPKSPIWAPSPTVHTKKAQQEILAMFNKTLDCERNDMTLNQTEEQTIRDTFEQQFNVTHGLNSDRGAAFKILDEDENGSSMSPIESHSLQDSNEYTTQAGNLELYDVKELSPIEEFSEEERSRQSFLSSWLNNDKSTTISRSRLTSSESEDLQLGVMPYITETTEDQRLGAMSYIAETTEDQRLGVMSYIAETTENEIFVPNEVVSRLHASDSIIRAERQMSAGNASFANSVNSSARVQDAAVLFDINFIEKAASGLSFENYQNFLECSSEHLSEKFAVNSKVQMEQDVYKILKKIAVGGFSTVYSCISLNQNGGVSDMQNETALKVMKSESLCRWEFYISQQLHQRIEMQQLGSDLHESFILPNKAYTFRDGSVIAYPYYSAGTLLDFVNRCAQNNVKIQEKAAIAYTADICKIVKAMHDCDIIHGDIKPDNFLIRSDNIEDLTKINRLTIADFGRSIDLTMFPSDVTFIGSCNTDKFECTEMRKNLPWKYQVDYFAIACTIHVVVHGTYMEILSQPGGYRPSKTFRRVWNRNFWFSVFDRLLNVPDCGKQTILGEIIDECEKRLADA